MRAVGIVVGLFLAVGVAFGSPVRGDAGADGVAWERMEVCPYQRVAYLESSGQEWVDLEFFVEATDTIKVIYHNVTAMSSTGRYLQGWFTYGVSYWGANNGYYDQFSGVSSNVPLGENDCFVLFRSGIVGEYDYIEVNGTIIYRTNSASKQAGWLTLFSITPNGNYRGAWRMGDVEIWRNGILSAHYVPVRTTNDEGEDVGAYFERMSGGVFFNNRKATGAFIIGPDL